MPSRGKKERRVPINDKARVILLNRKGHQHLVDRRVFWHYETIFVIDSMWRRVTKKTGIKNKFHELRKTFASYYMMNGGGVYKLQEILGHSDLCLLRVYSGLSIRSLLEDRNIVNF